MSSVIKLCVVRNESNPFRKLATRKRNDRIPGNVFCLGFNHFKKNTALQLFPLSKYRTDLYKTLDDFVLDDKLILQRENERPSVECPRSMRIIYDLMCTLLDLAYKNKPIDRFWFLENIARMPYVSYVAVLHLYETLGWWYVDEDIKREHVEQEANETHHLSIMYSLYGDRFWWNQFVTRHVAILYYVLLVVLFMLSPKTAYLSSELLEMHAYDTYFEFAQQNKRKLQKLAPTYAAIQYMPRSMNMYDVFSQIAEDEREHASDMQKIRK